MKTVNAFGMKAGLFILAFCLSCPAFSQRSYYVSPTGHDEGSGVHDHPWRTIGRLNQAHLHAGDSVYFQGGARFEGSITLDSTVSGDSRHPIIISSYGNSHSLATIQSENGTALSMDGCRYMIIRSLSLQGAGRKEGNTENGLLIRHCRYIRVDSLDISGYQKSGLLIHSSSDVRVTRVHAHENGAAGIAVEGTNGSKDCRELYFGHCLTDDNPGDPTNLTNHSGNGIVVGNCRKVTIEYCTATNNGWDMPRIGNGPVGIWAYEADSVTIQYCLSYRNKTSVGGADGGGFDLDGGVTNSVVQYCFSYENQGAGYCIFQYLYASPWHDNVFRYNISENDGLVSDARAGIHVWNSSRDKDEFYNCLFYNNTIYNTRQAAISFSELSDRKGFRFFNNIFVGVDSLVKGEDQGLDIFEANDWWLLGAAPEVGRASEGNHRASAGIGKGPHIDPAFKAPGHATIALAQASAACAQYQLPAGSPLQHSGLEGKGMGACVLTK